MTETAAATDRKIYLFTGVFSAVLYTVLLVAPVIAGPLTTKFGLDEASVGLLFSLELGAFSLATVPAYLWLTRVPLTVSVSVCTVIVAAGHVMSGFVTDFEALLVVRVITSLAAGSITVVLLSLGPKSSNPGRAFGIFVVAQLAMGALILAAFPALFAGRDVSAIYWTLAGLTALCLLCVPQVRGLSISRSGSTAPRLQGFLVVRFVAGLVSILLFYVALSGVWTFIGKLAVSAGIAEKPTALVLAVATAAGIASALLATALGNSPRAGLYLVGGLAGMTVSVLLLFGASAMVVFVAAALLFKFAWTFVLPYLLSSVSALGGGPQTMNTTNLMIGSGFAIGPYVAGRLIAADGGTAFGGMLTFAVVCLVLSLVLALVLVGFRLVLPAGVGAGVGAAR